MMPDTYNPEHELELIAAIYGDDWERDADDLRTHIETADMLDWLDGTEPSPVISGGEVLYPSYAGGEMPF